MLQAFINQITLEPADLANPGGNPMKKYLLAMLSAAALGFASQAVNAADDGAPTVYDWSGLYVGLQGGGSWSTLGPDIPAYVPGPPDGDISGLVLGAYAGYNFDVGDGFMYGVELGGNWRDVNGANATVFIPGEDLVTEQDWDASAVARIGMPMDNFMPYGLAGVSATGLSSHYEIGAVSSTTGKDMVFGWTVGAGLEAAVSARVHARLEYRYTGYGQADVTCSVCGPTAVDLMDQTALLGVSYGW